MKRRLRRSIFLAVFAAVCLAQVPEPEPPPARLPNGKLQRDEILKEDLAENLKDAAQLVELSQQLRADLEKSGRYVFSLSDRKKAEDIEKLARRIRMRMEHN
jgi:hypothetical protein